MLLWGNRFVLSRFKRIKIFLLIFSLTVLLLANAGSKAPVLANDDFQRRNGEIIDARTPEDGITILVRGAPPTVSGLGYRLANEICSVDDGTQFVATERRNVVNGEVWYRVEITDVVPQPSNCPETPFIGWIIGQFANGDQVVVLESVALAAPPIPIPQTTPEPTPTADPSSDPASTPNLVPDPTLPESTPTVSPDPTPTPVPTPSPQATIPPTTISDTPTPTEEAQNIGGGLQWFSLLGHYSLLSFGAIFGFIVISIERADNNSEFDVFPEGESFWEGLKKVRKIYWIRLGIAVFVVNLFRFSALNLVGVTGLENELVMASFRFITQGFLGSFIGGFVLAVVLLKFVSFTEN